MEQKAFVAMSQACVMIKLMWGIEFDLGEGQLKCRLLPISWYCLEHSYS